MAKPLQDQYWVEKDPELRFMILLSLESTVADLSAMEAFFKQVAAQEENRRLVGYARETLDNMNEIRAAAAAIAGQKEPSAQVFQQECAKLFASLGRNGSYDTLGIASTADDELRLKSLRERILQRDSDEAFYDYQKVNEIIMWNRVLKATGGIAPVQPASAGDSQPARRGARTPEK
jgi:hypothetical protein